MNAKTFLKYGAILVGAYLLVAHANGSLKVGKAGSGLLTGETKALQGR